MDSDVFGKAIRLRDEGQHNEAAEIFLSLARQIDNAFERAGMLLNVANSLKSAGHLADARKQLNLARELLISGQDCVFAKPDGEMRHRLLIGADVEEARISAAAGDVSGAIASLDAILTRQSSALSSDGYADVYQAIQRDRAFLLTDSGRCEEALPILVEANSADPHDRWTLFYLGYCYHITDQYLEANSKLEEAISLNLPSVFESQAHCLVGVAYFKLGNYTKAKIELEEGAKTAPPAYLKEAKVWRWLECTCASLGLRAEAERYRMLANPS